MENVDVARLFQQVADLLELRGDNPFRVRAYRTAARTIESMPKRVAELVAHDGKSLAQLPGIGKDLAGKIVEESCTGVTSGSSTSCWRSSRRASSR